MNARLAIRAIAQILVMPLPWAVRRPLLNLVPGFELSRGSRLGLCLILAERLIMAKGAAIGHFNLVSPIGILELRACAQIGGNNRIAGGQATLLYGHEPNRLSGLILGEHAAITRRHLIDCTNLVEVGDYALVAGWCTQILSHGPDFAKSRQSSAPVKIGAYSFIGTGSILLKGAEVPARSILAAGSVVSGKLQEEYHIYAGAPAKAVRRLDSNLAFFRRPVGPMSLAWEDGGEVFGG